MKIIVAFSGGKDSLASLIWAVNEYGKDNVTAVFCDTNWEHDITYDHIGEVIAKIGVELVTVKSKKYKGMLDLAKKKGRFPSPKARFCTEELKTKPMIDYILSLKTNVLIIQGIRKDESLNRSKMEKHCTFFKYYLQPYGHDLKNRPKFHKYRRRDVLDFRKHYSDDILRPVFDWTGQAVMQYILDNGFRPNELYYNGFKRVGCMPCIMCSQKEVNQMLKKFPERGKIIAKAEKKLGTTFFPPEYIPERYRTKEITTKDGRTVKVSTFEDVERYLNDKNATGDMFDQDNDDHKCMSFYSICE